MMLVHVTHVSDGFLLKLEMNQIPVKGDIVVIFNEPYEVIKVRWSLTDSKIVTLVVEEVNV
jgi:hypothetical protein